MSGESPSSAEGSLSEVVELLASFGDEISKNEDLIETAIGEHVRGTELPMTSAEVGNGVATALTAKLGREDAERVSNALLNYLALSSRHTIQRLQNEDVSAELTDTLVRLLLKYQRDVTKVAAIDSQGQNFWSSISTDLVVRSPYGDPGFAHTIRIAHDREVVIDTDLGSNMQLIRNLVRRQAEAIDSFPEGTANQVSEDALVEVSELLEEIASHIEEHSSEEVEDGTD